MLGHDVTISPGQISLSRFAPSASTELAFAIVVFDHHGTGPSIVSLEVIDPRKFKELP
jgi:hypothetical protein